MATSDEGVARTNPNLPTTNSTGRLLIVPGDGHQDTSPLGSVRWSIEGGKCQHCIETDSSGRIKEVMDSINDIVVDRNHDSFPLDHVSEAFLRHGLRIIDISSGDHEISFEINLETGHTVARSAQRHQHAPRDLGKKIFDSIKLALERPMHELAEKVSASAHADDVAAVLRQAQTDGVLGFRPTHSILAALETVDVESADQSNREYLRRARLEVAQRLNRPDIIAREAEAILAEHGHNLPVKEQAQLELAVAIGMQRRGQTEAALETWRRLAGPDTPLDAGGRGWAWRNISLALAVSDPEARKAAQRSADAFLQAGDKYQAGASLLRMADCLMTEAPVKALEALDQMFVLVEQESITNRDLRAAVHHARANRLLTLRNAALALKDAEQAIALRRELHGSEERLASSLHVAAAALSILDRKDEARALSDEASALLGTNETNRAVLAEQAISLFQNFDNDIANKLEQDARRKNSWEVVSAVVAARALHDPSLAPERRLSLLEGLISELRSVNAPSTMMEVPRQAIAELLTRMQKFDRAFGWWQALAQDLPWNDNVLRNFLNCCTELQKWPEAEKILRGLLALRGELPGIKFLLGRVILSAGRPSEALTILHEASKLAEPDSDLLRNIFDWQRKAMDAGANIVASKPPPPATEVSRQELEAALDEFAFQVSAQHRMKFWRKKGNKREWIERPEALAQTQLHIFLSAKFGDRIAVFDEIFAGAGRLDLYLQLAGGTATVIELKMCGGRYSSTYAAAGEEQILHYMENCRTNLGYLIAFDARFQKFGTSILTKRAPDAHTVFEKFVDVRPDWRKTPKLDVS